MTKRSTDNTFPRSIDAIILGAGASGLMAAATASRRGRSVLVIDHGTRMGKKLAMAGGGKGNITNTSVRHTDYYGANPQFARSALSRFTPEDLLYRVREEAIPLEERDHGQIFCRRTAEDMVELLRRAASTCLFSLETTIVSISHADGLFEVLTDKGTCKAPSLVIATGSPAWPQAGATDLGARLAKQFGHKVIPWRPALVGLTMPSSWIFAGLAGVSFQVDITVPPEKDRKNVKAAENLSLLITHRGISGPAALQASLYIETGDALLLDLLPGYDLDAILKDRENGKKQLKSLLCRLLPARVAERLLPEELDGKNIAELSAKARQALCRSVHACVLTPTGTEGMKKAEVAKGGVNTAEVSSKTMESRLVPGLFFCGEVLDVTGRLGGYNLHWAFASGRAAGEAV